MISRKDLRIWTKDSVMSAKIIYQNHEELGNGELGIQKIFSFFFFFLMSAKLRQGELETFPKSITVAI